MPSTCDFRALFSLWSFSRSFSMSLTFCSKVTIRGFDGQLVGLPCGLRIPEDLDDEAQRDNHSHENGDLGDEQGAAVV